MSSIIDIMIFFFDKFLYILNRQGGESFPEDPIKVIDRKNRDSDADFKPFSPGAEYNKKDKRFEFGNVLFGGPW